MPSSVTHFEIYADEPSSLADFYRELFGWSVERAQGTDYFMIQTGSGSPNGLRGGLTHRPIQGPKSWVHYVSVDSLEETVKHVEQLGGTVVRPRTAVPKVAWYAVVADPEGNIFALWQPDPHAFPPPEADV